MERGLCLSQNMRGTHFCTNLDAVPETSLSSSVTPWT